MNTQLNAPYAFNIKFEERFNKFVQILSGKYFQIM